MAPGPCWLAFRGANDLKKGRQKRGSADKQARRKTDLASVGNLASLVFFLHRGGQRMIKGLVGQRMGQVRHRRRVIGPMAGMGKLPANLSNHASDHAKAD